MIKALIVEDEAHCLKRIETLLLNFSDDITIVGAANSVNSAKEAINSLSPELLFLDIQLSNETSFDLLNQLDNTDFEIIFTTAYNHFAIDAFKLSAIDYLLKPLDLAEFTTAINKAILKLHSKDRVRTLETLLYNLSTPTELEKTIVISSQKAINIIPLKEIIRCSSVNEGNYTEFIIQDQNSLVATKSLKYYESLLPRNVFFRCHQSHIVARTFIRKLDLENGNLIKLDNNQEAPLSGRKKNEFIDWISS